MNDDPTEKPDELAIPLLLAALDAADAYMLRLRQIVYSSVPGVPARAAREIDELRLASHYQNAQDIARAAAVGRKPYDMTGLLLWMKKNVSHLPGCPVDDENDCTCGLEEWLIVLARGVVKK